MLCYVPEEPLHLCGTWPTVH